MRQMAGVFAQLDRAMITKRLSDGRRVKADKGGYVGGSPGYGYRAEGGELVEDPTEQAVIARMLAMRSSGTSLNTVANTLNHEGVPTKRGGRWSAASVARIIDPAARDRARRQVQVARGRVLAACGGAFVRATCLLRVDRATGRSAHGFDCASRWPGGAGQPCRDYPWSAVLGRRSADLMDCRFPTVPCTGHFDRQPGFGSGGNTPSPEPRLAA